RGGARPRPRAVVHRAGRCAERNRPLPAAPRRHREQGTAADSLRAGGTRRSEAHRRCRSGAGADAAQPRRRDLSSDSALDRARRRRVRRQAAGVSRADRPRSVGDPGPSPAPVQVRRAPVSHGGGTAAHHEVPASSLMLVVVLSLTWGCNWPVLKLGVTELAPLTFRASTLGFSGLALLVASGLSGQTLRIERKLWPRLIALSLVNITGWSALIVYGVQLLPAGRSAILSYTMPIWGVLFS